MRPPKYPENKPTGLLTISLPVCHTLAMRAGPFHIPVLMSPGPFSPVSQRKGLLSPFPDFSQEAFEAPRLSVIGRDLAEAEGEEDPNRKELIGQFAQDQGLGWFLGHGTVTAEIRTKSCQAWAKLSELLILELTAVRTLVAIREEVLLLRLRSRNTVSQTVMCTQVTGELCEHAGSDPVGPEGSPRFGMSNQLPDDNDAFSTKDLVFQGVTNHIRRFSYLLIPLTGFGPGGQVSPIGLARSIKNGTPLATESARNASGQEIPTTLSLAAFHFKALKCKMRSFPVCA